MQDLDMWWMMIYNWLITGNKEVWDKYFWSKQGEQPKFGAPVQ